MRDADAVFVFDAANYERLWSEFPFVRRRLHFLGALDPREPLVIDDPFGLDSVAFEQTYGHITKAILGVDANIVFMILSSLAW